MAWEEYCAACTYMKENANYGKFWCEMKNTYKLANEIRCYNYCEARRRSNSTRENMIYISRNANSGCYLTTIMCKLLEFPDNNYYLNTLRNFRDNVMQTNPNYLPLLLTYDVVGPVISEKLINETDGKQIAETFFNNYIEKAVTAVEEKKNETAIKIYTAMTQALADKYQITIPLMEVDSNINPQELGHGYTRKRTYQKKKDQFN